jgi:hypothetical protein
MWLAKPIGEPNVETAVDPEFDGAQMVTFFVKAVDRSQQTPKLLNSIKGRQLEFSARSFLEEQGFTWVGDRNGIRLLGNDVYLTGRNELLHSVECWKNCKSNNGDHPIRCCRDPIGKNNGIRRNCSTISTNG